VLVAALLMLLMLLLLLLLLYVSWPCTTAHSTLS
jgi:hypothetical protein